jgi:hypothetical protein
VLQLRVTRRFRRLRTILDNAVPEDLDRRTSFVVIESHAAWSSFCKYFYVSCALGGTDNSGNRVLPRASRHASEDAAIHFAIMRLSPTSRGAAGKWSPRQEPTWFETATLRKLLDALGSANRSTVTDALSLAPGSVSSLTTFRNFYAHRGQTTARKTQAIALRHLLAPARHPTAILNDYPPGRPQTLLRDFLDDIEAVVLLMN